MKTNTRQLSTRQPSRWPHRTSTPRPKPARLLPLALLLGAGLLLAAPRSHGTTYSWSGDGSTGNWSESANWGSVGVPGNGDTLIFSAGQPRLTNTNNISGLSLSQVRFLGASGGYTIWGNSFTISSSSIEATNTAGTNTINNAITLGASPVTVNVGSGASLTLAGALGGTGGLTKNGAGTLTLAGPLSNTYGGTTTVNAGLVALMKNGSPAATAIPGSLVIGDGVSSATVRNIYGNEIADSANLTINANGTWDLNNISETVGPNLTLAGGAIQSGTGTATLSANAIITVSGSPTVSGKLNIGSGTCTFQGSGYLYLYANVSGSANIVKNDSVSLLLLAANSFTGTLTANTSGYLYLEDNAALGATNSGTVLNGSTHLYLYGGLNITNEPLTLNTTYNPAIYVYASQTNSWSSTNFTLSADAFIQVQTNGALELIGPIGGTGGVNKWGPGTLRYSGDTANT